MILLDDRVGSRELGRHLRRGAFRLVRLPFADASWSGSGPDEAPWLIGLERKTLADFLSSMLSGRLPSHQLPGLLRSFNVVYLVVEGAWRRSSGGSLQCPGRRGWGTFLLQGRPFAWDTLVGMLATLSACAGLIVLTSHDLRETAALTSALHDWWERPWSSHRSHLRPRESCVAHLADPTLVQQVAAVLPGIGPERSRDVAARFSSVLDLAIATESDWRGVPGIGPVLAARMVSAIHNGGAR